MTSTLGRPVSARPVDAPMADRPRPPAFDGLPPLPGLPEAPRPSTGRWGGLALLSAVVLVLGILGMGIYTATKLLTARGPNPEPPTQEEMVELIEQHPELLAIVSSASIVFSVIAIVGLGFSIAALRASAQRDWRGWVGLVVCAGFVLLSCIGIVN